MTGIGQSGAVAVGMRGGLEVNPRSVNRFLLSLGGGEPDHVFLNPVAANLDSAPVLENEHLRSHRAIVICDFIIC
jgi:hypothetical protein